MYMYNILYVQCILSAFMVYVVSDFVKTTNHDKRIYTGELQIVPLKMCIYYTEWWSKFILQPARTNII
jgi:hypothetical protein